MKSHVFDK